MFGKKKEKAGIQQAGKKTSDKGGKVRTVKKAAAKSGSSQTVKKAAAKSGSSQTVKKAAAKGGSPQTVKKPADQSDKILAKLMEIEKEVRLEQARDSVGQLEDEKIAEHIELLLKIMRPEE